jgi:hypothetical protein
MHARRIINRMILSSAMSEAPEIGPRALAPPVQRRDSRFLHTIEENILTTDSRAVADKEMERLLLEVRAFLCTLCLQPSSVVPAVASAL